MPERTQDVNNNGGKTAKKSSNVPIREQNNTYGEYDAGNHGQHGYMRSERIIGCFSARFVLSYIISTHLLAIMKARPVLMSLSKVQYSQVPAASATRAEEMRAQAREKPTLERERCGSRRAVWSDEGERRA